jgi:hypothetical protein
VQPVQGPTVHANGPVVSGAALEAEGDTEGVGGEDTEGVGGEELEGCSSQELSLSLPSEPALSSGMSTRVPGSCRASGGGCIAKAGASQMNHIASVPVAVKNRARGNAGATMPLTGAKASVGVRRRNTKEWPPSDLHTPRAMHSTGGRKGTG